MRSSQGRKLYSTDAAAVAPQDVITPEFWHAAVGCRLTDLVKIALLLNVGALVNGGYYDPGWLQQPNFAPIVAQLPASVLHDVTRRMFFATRDEFRATAEQHRSPDRLLRRYEFNPLVVHPFVAQPDGRFIAPEPQHVLKRVTPGGLYYVGAAHGDSAFTTALGATFEHYVGQQLELLHPEKLLHDVEYRRGQRTADWIVVLPSAVMIVEVKATPLSEGARLGTSRLDDDLERAPGRAIKQIDRTVQLIRDRHPALASVPDDRPIVGVVTTLEPYFQCNSDLVWRRESGTVPVVLASSRELEGLVCITDADVGAVLAQLAADPERSRWNLGNALQDRTLRRNPILEAAWSRYDFESDAA